MLSLRKKISDLKNRPLNWDRVPYVISKNEYFLSTWGDRMCRKNDPKKSEWGGILTTKRSNFERCHKSDKKMIVLRLNKAKKRPFLATKKNETKSRSRTGRSLGSAGRPAGRRIVILPLCGIWEQRLRRNNHFFVTFATPLEIGPFCRKNLPSFWLFGIVFTRHYVSPCWQKVLVFWHYVRDTVPI